MNGSPRRPRGFRPPGQDRPLSTVYGLAIVAGLADSFSHFGTSGGAAVLWAEVRLAGDVGGDW